MLNYRINNQISAKELRLLGPSGENLGVFSKDEALAMAKERGVDLIEVIPHAAPPVARLISFDKFRYEAEKARKKERQAQKMAEGKRVQITVRAAGHDLQIKVNQLEKFLAEGHPVEVFVRLRGREKYNRPWAEQKLREFLSKIKTEHKLVSPPKFGMGLSVQIIKK